MLGTLLILAAGSFVLMAALMAFAYALVMHTGEALGWSAIVLAAGLIAWRWSR